MGLISFIKSAGQKLGLVAAETPKQPSPEQLAAANKARAASLLGQIAAHGIELVEGAVTIDGETATVTGTVTSQADSEKAVLIVGNTAGISGVDNQITVEVPEPPAVYHTVVKGDTLSAIAKENYGVMRMFDVIFEANKPMLESPDLIYPGQVLRIPPVAPPVHTVARGETLGGIAKHWYGDTMKYTAIFEANTDKLDNPNAIDVGQALTIPLIDPKVTLS